MSGLIRGERMGLTRWVGASVLLAVMIAVIPVPARSQTQTPPSEPLLVRPGEWQGESIAHGVFQFVSDGAPTTWTGGITTGLQLDVDDVGRISGSWELDGNATVSVEQQVPVLFLQTHAGSGGFDDLGPASDPISHRGLLMTGAVRSSGTAKTLEGTLAVGPFVNEFQSGVRIIRANCYELEGDWINPLKELAADEGWELADVDGFFRASFVGDEPDEAVIERIAQLNADAQAWADEMVASGVVNVLATFALLTRAREIAVSLAETGTCPGGDVPDPTWYLSSFTFGLALGMFSTLQAHDLSGSGLLDMVAAMGALGNSGSRDMVSTEIQKQTQRIVGSNATAYGDGCSPCVDSANADEVIEAAVAGEMLGQETFEIEGETFFSDKVVEAAVES